MQLTAAIAPNGNQWNVADLPTTVIDLQALQQLFDKFGARFNELLGGYACVERTTQPAMENIHMGFNMRAGQLVRRPYARVIGLIGEGGKCCVSILFG